MVEADEVVYSPHSKIDGIYPDDEFQPDALQVVADFAKKNLNKGEWIVPWVPEQIIEKAVAWYANSFLQMIIKDSLDLVNTSQVCLENFKTAADKYLVTSNLNGARWFTDEFEKSCLKQLIALSDVDSSFGNVSSISEAGINILEVKVTSSTGHQAFGKAKVVDFDGSKMIGKHVISLDDIGDRGITQKTVKEEALAAGAAEVTTVNLIEKQVPDTVPEDQQKKSHPDVALLAVAYQFLLGWGLDDGTRDITRELRTIVALFKENPELAWVAYQGGQSAEPDV
jgi:hypoxanthine-guanine phosphoribosyltransferase